MTFVKLVVSSSSHFRRSEDLLPCSEASTSSLKKGPSANRPPVGFFSFWRFQTQPATNVEFASLDCAAPSGFLNLLTLYSGHALSALFRAESALRISALRGFPLPGVATAYTATGPSASNTTLHRRFLASIRRSQLGRSRGGSRFVPLRRTVFRETR